LAKCLTRGRLDEVRAVRKQKSSQLTRERIITAGVEIIVETGMEGFSMRVLGQRLGVTQMMPYRHFASKDVLFVEIKRLVFDRFDACLDECASEGAMPEMRLRKLCLGYVRFGCEAPADYELIFGRWSSSIYRAVLEADGFESLNMTRIWSAMLNAVAALRGSTADDADVDVASHVVWEALHGLVNLNLAKKLGFGKAVAELVEPVVENLISIAATPNPAK
jgi:AcrR family transcriptional regulator